MLQQVLTPFALELHTVKLIRRNSAMMDRMVSELLDVQRITIGKLNLKPEKTDVTSVLKEAADMFASVAENKLISIEIDNPLSVLNAEFDRDRILQVLSNLIGNAVKFTQEGGKVILSAKMAGMEIEISVQDSGRGIANESKSQLFELYSQLDRHDRTGLGLGLFICKSIVEAHGGSISVTSEPGIGSVFSFVIPVLFKNSKPFGLFKSVH